MSYDRNTYGVVHTETCASGDRAEKRGACDCGAEDGRPWRLRAELENPDKPMVHVIVDRELTLREAVELSVSIQELTKLEGQRWGQREMKRLEREAKALRAEKDEVPPWER